MALLGATMQLQGEHAAADRLYAQAMRMFTLAGDASGTAHCHESLGVLAQARGDYRNAERHYRRAAGDTRRAPAPRTAAATKSAPAENSYAGPAG